MISPRAQYSKLFEMEFEKTASPYGYCTFCEDIRQEMNGKQTYVGVVVGTDLNIQGVLPAGIGKFSIFATFRQRLTDGLGPVVFEVHMPGDEDDKPSARMEFSITDIIANLPAVAPDIDDPFLGIGLGFEFNPLLIKQEGRIQVSAFKAGKRYKLGSLRVISRPPAPLKEKKEAAN